MFLIQCNLASAKQVLGFKLVEFKSDIKFDSKQIVIPSSEMWVFYPGIEVSVPNGAKFFVQGKIRVGGSERSPITFKSEDGYWNGFIFTGDRKNELKKIVSKKIPTGLSFIRYAKFYKVGSPSSNSTPLFTLYNHEGIIVHNTSIDESLNFSVASLTGSEIYLDDLKIDGSVSYPVINSFNALVQMNNVTFPSTPMIETALALFNSAAIISGTQLIGERLLIDSDHSIVQINSSKIESASFPIFQNQSVISLKDTTVINASKDCAFNQSHDSMILDFDARWYCSRVWPSLIKHPDEDEHPYRAQLEKLIQEKFYKKGILIPFMKYKTQRKKVLSKTFNWKSYSKKAKFSAEEFIFYADIKYLYQWVLSDNLFRSRAKDPNERYVNFQRNVASGIIATSKKVDRTINEMLALKKNYIGELPISGYCAYQDKKWLQNFSQYKLELFPVRGIKRIKRASNFCFDFARDYFINFEQYHQNLIGVYRSMSPINL